MRAVRVYAALVVLYGFIAGVFECVVNHRLSSELPLALDMLVGTFMWCAMSRLLWKRGRR